MLFRIDKNGTFLWDVEDIMHEDNSDFHCLPRTAFSCFLCLNSRILQHGGGDPAIVKDVGSCGKY